MPVRRHTFLVQIREPDWGTVVEDTRTGRRAALGDLGEVGTQIASWLDAPAAGERPGDALAGPDPDAPVGTAPAAPVARRPGGRAGPAAD